MSDTLNERIATAAAAVIGPNRRAHEHVVREVLNELVPDVLERDRALASGSASGPLRIEARFNRRGAPRGSEGLPDGRRRP
jgi:hypothetical protein